MVERTIRPVWVAVSSTFTGGGTLLPLDRAGVPAGPPQPVTDLAEAVRERECADGPRWVWADTAEVYPALLAAGARVARCHDLALTEALLSGYDGRWGEPRSLAAAWSRLHGLPVPDDPPPRPRDIQPALFEPDRMGLPDGVDHTEVVAEVYRAQMRRIADTEHPDRLRLLVAAESAGALAAAEMAHHGLPWRADVHDAVLVALLGERPPPGTLPPRLRALAEQIRAAFGGRRVNPDSPADVVRAFGREGIELSSARSGELRRVDHPGVPLLLEYKELSRLYAAHGWAWLESWVHDGRFRPEYVAGGVVSGRWTTRGGGALQIPRSVRAAVIADPGWTLVVADAAQLEPRVLAALAGDHGLARAAGSGDLYAALADEVFGGDRGRAKIGLLAAMYGQTGGEAAPLLATLRRRFPDAIGFVEAAARDGEAGRLVRSRLGRTCPPPSQRWRDLVTGAGSAGTDVGTDPGSEREAGRRAGQAARDRGRFTRNFVVQATAAEWALVLLAVLRGRLAAIAAEVAAAPELVFFQHDEVVVHCPRDTAEAVVGAITDAGAQASRLVFGDTPVRFPLEVSVVERYSDAK